MDDKAVPSAAFDSKALDAALAIADMTALNRTQLVARIQLAVLDAMRWAATSTDAQEPQHDGACFAAWLPIPGNRVWACEECGMTGRGLVQPPCGRAQEPACTNTAR